ncbi:MAG: hypothetical protein ACE5KM_02995 [Planctomycetaceae bacterium]
MSTLNCKNCKEFDALLSARLARPAADDGPLLAHAKSCARCADVLSEDQTIDVAVRQWNAALPRPDLSDRVVARWRAEAVPPVGSRPLTLAAARRSPGDERGRRLLLGAVAAALCVAAVSLLYSSRSNPVGETAAGPNRKPADVVDRSHDAPHPERNANRDSNRDDALEVQQLVDGFRKQYSNVTRHVTRKMAALKLPPLEGVGGWPNFDRDPVGVAPPKPGSKADWGAGLRPVERDVRKAFGFLRDAVPILNDSST